MLVRVTTEFKVISRGEEPVMFRLVSWTVALEIARVVDVGEEGKRVGRVVVDGWPERERVCDSILKEMVDDVLAVYGMPSRRVSVASSRLWARAY